jgi:hypothetical protein
MRWLLQKKSARNQMDLAELLDHVSSQSQVTGQAGRKGNKNVCRSGFFDPVNPHVQTSLLKPCAGFCKKICTKPDGFG